jgi:hypothetical protein
MKILDGLEKKPDKSRMISIRVTEETVRSIKIIARKYNISKSDLVEHLVSVAKKELDKGLGK